MLSLKIQVAFFWVELSLFVLGAASYDWSKIFLHRVVA